MTSTRFEQLIRLLSEQDVEFVLVGGLAATVHGSAYVMYDVDVSYGLLLGEMEPFGGYERVDERSERIELFGRSVQVLTLEALIEAKRAAGRRKDLLMIPELEALLELRKPPTD